MTCKLDISAKVLLHNIREEYSFSLSETAAVIQEKFPLSPPRIVLLWGLFRRVWCVKWPDILSS